MTRFVRRLMAGGFRRMAIVATAVVVLGVGSAMVVQAADPRLTDADAALQKAEALVLASEPGTVPWWTQRTFQRHTDRAVDLIDRAREHVQAAKDAVDDELQSSTEPITPSVGSATVVQAADPRLTDADAALQKAEALVLASEPGNVPWWTQRTFQRHTDRAAELIERAREHVQAAKDAVDAEQP